ncbi:MarR family EPS-associated transcriptional regulator [Pelagibacterales bacterium SAG-MED41]|nr:MarR family EPS-associated transcriptional regulator [Pelagibacterales bacterium SAG-MED41]|tara:strand:+ start:21 stop:344 length:324 start_codon:yes stop_codon:yes gene_type:complete
MDDENKSDQFEVLRKLNTNPSSTQRELSNQLGFSLGKINYCLKSLKNKGYIKLKNFQSQEHKIKYLRYIITRKGIAFRTRLTINFMKKKMKEYDQLKNELNKNKNNE